MDGFFDDCGWVLLLILAFVVLTNNRGLFGGLFEGVEAPPAPLPTKGEEEPCYIWRSSNRKRMRPKSVYF